jgi:DNA-directed RNA polymerase subunit F
MSESARKLIETLNKQAMSYFELTQTAVGIRCNNAPDNVEEIQKFYDSKWVSVETVTALLQKIVEEKTVAEERNVEYAKLVAGQAKEYAEKLRDKVLVSRKQLEDKKQIIQNLIEETEGENDKILEKLNEDKTTNSKDEAALRSSYWNNGYIQGMKQCRNLFGEAFSQKGSGVESENKKKETKHK